MASHLGDHYMADSIGQVALELQKIIKFSKLMRLLT
jgi:hypothetical protein